MFRSTSALLLTTLASVVLSPAQSTEYLVLLKGGNALAWYTPEGKMTGKVDVGQHPHEMVFSKDRRFLYTTDNGTMRIEQAGNGGNTISVIDLAAKKRIAQISTGEFRRPHGIDLDPVTGHLAVSTEAPDKLLIIDPVKRAVVRTYDTKGKTAHMVTFGPKAEYAYVSHSNSGNVAAIRLADGNVKLIQTGTRPEDSALARDGKRLYVTNRESAMISVIDTAKNEVAGTIATGKGPVRLALTPDGKQIVYALIHDKKVGFADLNTLKETATIPVEGELVSLSISADGKLAFASAENDDTIYVVSIADRKILKTIKTEKGSAPDPVVEYISGK